jgi:PhnB protein
MTIQAATPYLILHGRADKAIEFYRGALGATVETVLRFGDVDGSCPVAKRQLVMHAVLRVGKALVMLSDGGGEGELPRGGAVHVALDLDDAAETRRIFAALASTGTVIERIIDAPWGGLFGALVDQFGVPWMFNCSKRS